MKPSDWSVWSGKSFKIVAIGGFLEDLKWPKCANLLALEDWMVFLGNFLARRKKKSKKEKNKSPSKKVSEKSLQTVQTVQIGYPKG